MEFVKHEYDATDEQRREYTITTTMPLYNEQGLLRLEGYMTLFNNVVEEHLPNVTCSIPSMIERWNVSWALLSNHIYINRVPEQNEVLTAHTWCSEIKRMFFMRDIEFTDADGEVVFGGATTSALVDLAKREMLTSGEVYDAMVFENGPKYYPDRVKLQTRGYDLEPIGSVTVQPSWLDPLGHMNNTRYPEVFYNNVSEETRAKYARLKDFEIHWQQEMNLGEEILLQLCETDTEAVMCGYKKEADGKPGHLAFAGKMVFGEA